MTRSRIGAALLLCSCDNPTSPDDFTGPFADREPASFDTSPALPPRPRRDPDRDDGPQRADPRDGDGDGDKNPDLSHPVAAVAAGARHTCALLFDGRVRCFGRNDNGELGLGHTEPLGDDEPPLFIASVPLPRPAVAVAAAAEHSCAQLDDGAVWCWGRGTNGRLGSGNEDTLGDDEDIASGGPVPIGADVVTVVASGEHSCVLTATAAVRCWGHGTAGELGYGVLEHVGDDETVADAGDVSTGMAVAAVSVGPFTTCAIDSTGRLRCWGYSDYGEVGYPGRTSVGGTETPASLPPIDVGGAVELVAPGGDHTCALLRRGEVRCWGWGEGGRLGTGDTESVGEVAPPSEGAPVTLDEEIVGLVAGSDHTCGLTATGAVHCWGVGEHGRLGLGDEADIGDDEHPCDVGPVDLPGPAVGLTAGHAHTCAAMASGELYCWGDAAFGQLGYGSVEPIGDDETPAERGPVPL